jgi:hypothetical protein
LATESQHQQHSEQSPDVIAKRKQVYSTHSLSSQSFSARRPYSTSVKCTGQKGNMSISAGARRLFSNSKFLGSASFCSKRQFYDQVDDLLGRHDGQS